MKRVLCIVLTAVAAVTVLCACGKKADKMDRFDAGEVKRIEVVKVTDEESNYEIKKRVGIAEFVDIHNSVSYNKTDEVKPEEVLEGTMFYWTFYDFHNDVMEKCAFSPDGYLFIGDDMETVYKLTEKVTQDRLEELVKLYDVNAPSS